MDTSNLHRLSTVGLMLLAACAAPAPPAAAPAAPLAGEPGRTVASAPASADTPAPASAPPAPLHIVVNWTAPSGSMGAIWLAHDTGIFREEGLDAEVVNVQNSSRVIPAMLAGEIELSPLDPATTVQANQGGADFALLIAMRNRLGYSMTSQPSITQPQDLRGKSLGVTRVGASNHTAALVALRIWGLMPDRDVALRQLGETPAIIAALQAGQIDAASITEPVPRPIKAAYPELIDLAISGPEYASVALGARRSWVQGNEDAVRRYVRAHLRADQRSRQDKELTLSLYRKYMQLDDPELLDDHYASYLALAPRQPYVTEIGLARALDDLAADDPRLAGSQASDFIDSRFVHELENTGLFPP